VEQSFLGTASRGRYDILAVGELGAGLEQKLRVGVPVKVTGQLWLREFRNRKGTAVKEVKIVGKSISIVKPEPKIPASKQDEKSAPRQ
jgi:single-stranded DNA-binding protein